MVGYPWKTMQKIDYKSDRVLLDRDITKCLLLALIAFVLYFQNVVLHQIFENIFTRINNSMQEKLS